MLKNAAKHFARITKHKWYVLKLCIKAGIPWRGLVHDLSKYSFGEFLESAKYYESSHSPIQDAKSEKGYSLAWLHHKGRNKHHPEYWFDHKAPDKTPIIPYKYVVEMICDNLAAGMIYKGEDWTLGSQLAYWERVSEIEWMNEQVKAMLKEVFTQVSKHGIDQTIHKRNLQNLYYEYCEERSRVQR